MSNRYPGGFITLEEPDVSPAGATGVWTLSQQEGYEANGEWPSATYEISRSLRFNSADSAYLSRTPASNGNRKTFTWSSWLKRGAISTAMTLFGTPSTSGSRFAWEITSADKLNIAFNTGSTWYEPLTEAVFRDPSAWYHIVIACDLSQATDSNRVKVYVNGVQQTLTGTFPPDYDSYVNSTSEHVIGRYSTAYFNGYLTDINFIDGQQLTPSSFGKTNAVTGVWEPIIYAGSYGTNGFYLPFSDNSSTTALGYDESGNGNNWTPNNFSVTAGAGNDSLVDTPTPYGTDTGAGGEVRGNYAVLNPLNTFASPATFSNGNLEVENNSGTGTRQNCVATVGLPTTGKWYFEVSPLAMGSGVQVLSAIRPSTSTGVDYPGADSNNPGISVSTNGTRNFNAVYTSSYLPTSTVGDVLSCAYDADTGKVWFARNGTFVGSPSAGTSEAGTLSALTNGGTYLFDLCLLREGGASGNLKAFANFGQRPFAYTAPSGFKALCTQNLPEPTVVQGDDYFNTVLWTGTDTTANRSITGVGFQPDFVWAKIRSTTYNHTLFDAVRGTGKTLFSSLTNAEVTNDGSGYISSFDSDGFTFAKGSVDNVYGNQTGQTYVAWNWNAGGSTVTNTAGTISAQVRANTTSGFSIVTYTGTGANATVGHGLGVAPSMFILKERSGGTAADFWATYHASLGNTKYLTLNTTNAEATAAYWNNTTPSSSVITLGSNTNINDTGATYVIYAFAPVAGFSAFGSYTGNGSTDGPFVYTGFRPAFVLVKKSSSDGEGWWIYDNKRDTFNITDNILEANSSGAEISGGTYPIDMVSNGFKIRGINALLNTSGTTYIYACFAEVPFRYSLAR